MGFLCNITANLPVTSDAVKVTATNQYLIVNECYVSYSCFQNCPLLIAMGHIQPRNFPQVLTLEGASGEVRSCGDRCTDSMRSPGSWWMQAHHDWGKDFLFGVRIQGATSPLLLSWQRTCSHPSLSLEIKPSWSPEQQVGSSVFLLHLQ